MRASHRANSASEQMICPIRSVALAQSKLGCGAGGGGNWAIAGPAGIWPAPRTIAIQSARRVMASPVPVDARTMSWSGQAVESQEPP